MITSRRSTRAATTTADISAAFDCSVGGEDVVGVGSENENNKISLEKTDNIALMLINRHILLQLREKT